MESYLELLSGDFIIRRQIAYHCHGVKQLYTCIAAGAVVHVHRCSDWSFSLSKLSALREVCKPWKFETGGSNPQITPLSANASLTATSEDSYNEWSNPGISGYLAYHPSSVVWIRCKSFILQSGRACGKALQ